MEKYKKEIDFWMNKLEKETNVWDFRGQGGIRSVFFMNGNPNPELSNITENQAKNIIRELKKIFKIFSKEEL
jgi:hypothetical protein